MTQRILRGNGVSLAALTSDYIREQHNEGVRLFALEGLLGVGKTTTSKQILAHLSDILLRVELDDFHDPRGAKRRRTWDDAYMLDDAVNHISMLTRRRTILIEGAIARPTAERCEIPAKYLYLKRVLPSGEWADADYSTEYLNKQVLRISVRDYNVLNKPWQTADALLERIVESDGL